MTLYTEVTLSKNTEHNRDVIERLLQSNIDTKLDRYLEMYRKNPSTEGHIKLVIEQNKKGNFDATLRASFSGERFHYAREDYSHLNDLVNHLCDHLKEDMSSKKVSAVHS